MARIRNTARWGNSDVIMLKSSDKVDLDINIGKDKVDIEDMVVLREKKSKEDKT